MHARNSLLLALTCLCCATLGGCGQTGALYLPTQETEVVSKGPEAATTPADDAEATRKRESAVATPAPK